KLLILFLLLLPINSLGQKTHAQIAAQNADTIVSVNVAKTDGTTYSGTGFIVSANGLVATAGHVVEDAIFINLTFKNGAVSSEAVLLDKSQNPEIDLALLKIKAENLPYITFDNSDKARAGQEITVIGNPRRLQNTVTSGLISQIRQVSRGVRWFQISAPVSPSSSGSPVFNDKGYVIGIALSSLKGEDNQNINFAIPSNYLQQLMLNNGFKPCLPAADAKQKANQPRNWVQMFKNHVQKCWQILEEKVSPSK
ncbi:MAG: S1C family serine protease, partial [Elusimicrobiota bacterium]|nr:S1C family serine protease [Elusimicrobiota bacterium]